MISDANAISFSDVPEWQRRLGITDVSATINALLTRVSALETRVERLEALEAEVAALKLYQQRVPIYGNDGNVYWLQVEIVDNVAVLSDPVIAEGVSSINPAYWTGGYQVLLRGKPPYEDRLFRLTCTTVDSVQTIAVEELAPGGIALPLWNQDQQKFYNVTVELVDGVPSYTLTEAP